jgi:transcriptional regulator with XRE-family HTH domain
MEKNEKKFTYSVKKDYEKFVPTEMGEMIKYYRLNYLGKLQDEDRVKDNHSRSYVRGLYREELQQELLLPKGIIYNYEALRRIEKTTKKKEGKTIENEKVYGQRQYPRIHILLILADFFKTSLDSFFIPIKENEKIEEKNKRIFMYAFASLPDEILVDMINLIRLVFPQFKEKYKQPLAVPSYDKTAYNPQRKEDKNRARLRFIDFLAHKTAQKYMKKFSDNIRKIRKEIEEEKNIKISMREFSRALGLPATTIAEYERVFSFEEIMKKGNKSKNKMLRESFPLMDKNKKKITKGNILSLYPSVPAVFKIVENIKEEYGYEITVDKLFSWKHKEKNFEQNNIKKLEALDEKYGPYDNKALKNQENGAKTRVEYYKLRKKWQKDLTEFANSLKDKEERDRLLSICTEKSYLFGEAWISVTGEYKNMERLGVSISFLDDKKERQKRRITLEKMNKNTILKNKEKTKKK